MLKHMTSGHPGHNRSIRSNLNRSIQPLNVSTLSTPAPQHKYTANGGPRYSTIINTTPLTSVSSHQNAISTKQLFGAREALTSLGLLCLVSLLLALLSLIFLLKISPGRDQPISIPGVAASADDYIIVYDVTLALCALSLSLNLCCLLVCAIQFLFAVKLVRAPATSGRGNKYLQKSSVSRVCAVAGFFISIPIFLTGIILYTFTQFHSTSAIITSVLIGIGILFCGAAMVHNVFVWQKEKTICVRNQNQLNLNQISHTPQINAITPPTQFLNISHPINHNHTHTPLTHNSQITPITPLSQNQSHMSFNHSYNMPTYGVRAASVTPPTPKVITNMPATGREASGSISPGVALNVSNAALELSNLANSPHELSTLV